MKKGRAPAISFKKGKEGEDYRLTMPYLSEDEDMLYDEGGMSDGSYGNYWEDY